MSALDQFKDADEVGLWVFSTELGGPDPNVLDLVPIAPIGNQRDVLAQQIEAQVRRTAHRCTTSPTRRTRRCSRSTTRQDQRRRAAHRRPERRRRSGRRRGTVRRADPVAAVGSEGSSAQPVRLFTISYGEDADAITLRAVAQATRAATYNASNPATIEQVFTAVIRNF